MRKTELFIIFIGFSIIVSCKNMNHKSDAFGNFEADETIVSSEGNGKIMKLNIKESQLLKAGDTIGYIDTLQLHLKKKQLNASISALRAKTPDIPVQLDALQEQLRNAEHEKQRIINLQKGNAATGKQVDDINSQILVLGKQIAATRSTLSTQTNGTLSEIEPLKAQIDQIEDMISKSIIINPIKGTILSKYAEQFELATQGKPLYKISDISEITLRAYISEEQLSQVKLRQNVKVLVDIPGKNYKEYQGTISWIADKAEFTPKIIQTKDERVNLVYAIKILVKNDGSLKIGMPGEVIFK
ncbi:MAG: HlyD family efflux transporter periplasmic adaptor subunit [Bacteroidota bacterium]|nr:HlyD family efflux transporter periplasmic adaptor subunit [Bacteroidota bacterium]